MGYIIGFELLLTVPCTRWTFLGPLLAHSLAASYPGPKTAGQASSQVLSGMNTHISCHVSFPLFLRVCLSFVVMLFLEEVRSTLSGGRTGGDMTQTVEFHPVVDQFRRNWASVS